MLLHPFSVYLRAVPTIQVMNMPISIHKLELAVIPRHVRKPQHDIGTLAAADREKRLEERNRVTAANGKEFTEHEPGLP